MTPVKHLQVHIQSSIWDFWFGGEAVLQVFGGEVGVFGGDRRMNILLSPDIVADSIQTATVYIYM
jgi:hypothetical protein